jgi:septal ring factor EnvC (AmiA/AmiB activator)
MTDDPTESTAEHGLMRVLLAPLRTPQRVVGNIETIASTLLALSRDTHDRLASVDEQVGALLAPLTRLDQNVTDLQKLEQAVTEQTDAIRDDINTRLLAVEAEVQEMRAPIEGMSRDLATVVKLLPNPSDGPLARLRDTLTSS